MRIGVLFVLLALAMGALASLEGGLFFLLSWPALSFAIVGAGYLALGARVFGKRPDGTLPWWSRVLFAPYLALAWLIWQGLRRTSVRPYSLVAPRLYLARRLHAHELPEDVEIVVDLTAEFAAPLEVRSGRSYRALPALDGDVPDEAACRRLLEEIAASPATVLVHCAAGHGRSACFVAAILVKRGLATNVREAEALIKRARPTIRLRATQRALVTRLARAPL